MPKISAVMALYNTPYNYLQSTVESLLNQTFNDFELIVIDDASTVDYSVFFEQFNDERIKYFKLEKNAGPGHARNEGIKKATGEYIANCDSDDVYLPQRLELQAKFLDENPNISLIGTTFRFSNKKRLSVLPLNNADIKTFMLFNSPLCNPTIMFRREEFVSKNLFYPEDINFAEDYELWIDAMFSGVKMANLEDFLMIYTRRAGQLSKEKSEKQIAILKKLYAKILSNIGIEATPAQLELHHNIYTGNFSGIESSEKISKWFDKIIEHNKPALNFNEDKLLEKKIQTIRDFNTHKNRIFKLKIGNYNLCADKLFNISFIKRD